jgi:1-deoxy-D-xylulose-5-phosphate reductoisomerase
LFCGSGSAIELIRACRADLAVVAISGGAALYPLLEAIKKYPVVALASKEALVMAGEIVMGAAKRHHTAILPLDSEHSAIFQCLRDNSRTEVRRIYLTGSGGPLNNFSRARLASVGLKEVLKHPRWNMGKKITVDSATLMNKGLEVIEAMRLFGLPLARIKVLIHPEAVVHSMVEFVDGSVLAQMAVPDMRLPINYALNYPRRVNSRVRRLDFSHRRRLTFKLPDHRKFPCLEMALSAARKGGTAPCVLNAANEECVNAFLKGRIRFQDIPKIIGAVLPQRRRIAHPALDEIMQADRWARDKARQLIQTEKEGKP